MDFRNCYVLNNLPMQFDIQDRRKVYAILAREGIAIPRYAVLDRDSSDPKVSFDIPELKVSSDPNINELLSFS